MTASSVEADADALAWPQSCCCCGSTTGLDSIGIYSVRMFGPKHALIHIPYCLRCKSHHRSAGQRALGSAVAIFAVGITTLLVLFLFGMLNDQIVGFFLQLLVIFGAIAWAARTYLVARGETRKAITPGCSAAETAAVIFLTAQPDGWRFRFFSPTYAEQFAAANSGRLTTLL